MCCRILTVCAVLGCAFAIIVTMRRQADVTEFEEAVEELVEADCKIKRELPLLRKKAEARIDAHFPGSENMLNQMGRAHIDQAHKARKRKWEEHLVKEIARLELVASRLKAKYPGNTFFSQELEKLEAVRKTPWASSQLH